MLTALTHLSKTQLSEMVQLVEKIVQKINPDKIICYGTRTTITQDWSCFLDGDGYREIIYPSTYDLLIITNEGEKREDHILNQMVDQQAESLGCEVTSVVHRLSSVNADLENGNRFMSTIYQKAVLVYNGSDSPLTMPSKELSLADIISKAEEAWIKYFGIAQRFMKSATDCLNERWYEQALFNLHQAVQHSCVALIRVFTGYRPTTHSLSKLLALIENFSSEPMTIFPRTTKEETELFNLLNRAYSDARYNEQFTVPAEKATLLVNRGKEFSIMAERLYTGKIITMKDNLPINLPLTSINEKKNNI